MSPKKSKILSLLILAFFTAFLQPFKTKNIRKSTNTNQTINSSKPQASQPQKIQNPTPSTPKPKYCEEKTEIKTADGLIRKGILTTTENAKGNVILCHPITFNKEYMQDYGKKLFDRYNYLTFDFRLHGENNKKQYTTIGQDEVQEVEAAVKLLKEDNRTKNLPLYGFGISMGAAALIEAENKKHTFDGLILQSSYETMRKQIKRMYGFFKIPLMHNFIFRQPTKLIAKRLYRLKMRNVKPSHSVKNISTPIFLVHAKNDPFIPMEAFWEIKNNAKSVVKAWTPDDGEHTKILEKLPDLYAKNCNEFLDSLQRKVSDNSGKKETKGT